MWRIAVGAAAFYLLGVLVCLAVNVSVWTALGVGFGWEDVLECVYGPAIMLASAAVLWGLVCTILWVVGRLSSHDRSPRA